MRLYFRYELIVYIGMCFTSCVLPTYEYNALKCVHTHTHTYIYIYIYKPKYIHKYVFTSIFCNSDYGLVMTVKATPVSISCDFICKIIFDGGHYELCF